MEHKSCTHGMLIEDACFLLEPRRQLGTASVPGALDMLAGRFVAF